MPRIEEIGFPQGYLSTNVENHALIMDWAINLHDDSSLLLILLERLAAHSDEANNNDDNINNNNGGRRRPSLSSRRRNNNIREKDPIRVAHAYAQIQRLRNHEFNIFESAFFEDFESDFSGYSTRRGKVALLQAILVVGTQVFFTFIIISETIRNFSQSFEMGERFEYIVPIAILSAMIFFFAVTTHRFKSKDFNSIVTELACFEQQRTDTGSSSKYYDLRYFSFSFTAQAQQLCLLLNTISNEWLGALLVIINVPFVLTAENPTEAILNALATGFIIEIDDLVRRVITYKGKRSVIDWNNERTNQLMINLATRYVSNPNLTQDFQEIIVNKKTSIRRRQQPRPYRNGEECHVFVVQQHVRDDFEHIRTVSVLVRNNRTFDHVRYVISGPGMQSFVDDACVFNCYRQWKLREEFLTSFRETPENDDDDVEAAGGGSGTYSGSGPLRGRKLARQSSAGLTPQL